MYTTLHLPGAGRTGEIVALCLPVRVIHSDVNRNQQGTRECAQANMYEQPNSPPTHTHSGTGMGLRREPSGRTPVHQGQLSTSACHDDLLSSELDWCCSTLCQGRHDTHSDEQREHIGMPHICFVQRTREMYGFLTSSARGRYNINVRTDKDMSPAGRPSKDPHDPRRGSLRSTAPLRCTAC